MTPPVNSSAATATTEPATTHCNAVTPSENVSRTDGTATPTMVLSAMLRARTAYVAPVAALSWRLATRLSHSISHGDQPVGRPVPGTTLVTRGSSGKAVRPVSSTLSGPGSTARICGSAGGDARRTAVARDVAPES